MQRPRLNEHQLLTFLGMSCQNPPAIPQIEEFVLFETHVPFKAFITTYSCREGVTCDKQDTWMPWLCASMLSTVEVAKECIRTSKREWKKCVYLSLYCSFVFGYPTLSASAKLKNTEPQHWHSELALKTGR